MLSVDDVRAWALLALVGGGCATAAPVPISAQQERTFLDTVTLAERATSSLQNAKAEAALREAKSDFYYAQHLPMDPERARAMAAQAQAEADSAVALSAH